MLKKILSISLGICILLQAAIFAEAAFAEDDGEAFSLTIGILSEKRLKATPQNFTNVAVCGGNVRTLYMDIFGRNESVYRYK